METFIDSLAEGEGSMFCGKVYLFSFEVREDFSADANRLLKQPKIRKLRRNFASAAAKRCENISIERKVRALCNLSVE